MFGIQTPMQMPHVLRCSHCNKPFDHESTLKRHGYYCRSKKLGRIPRIRSCIPCAKRKARCDSKLPLCTRCSARGVQCTYPTDVPLSTGRKNQQDGETVFGQPKTASSLVLNLSDGESVPALNDNLDMSFDSALAVSGLDLASFGSKEFDWNNSNFDFHNFLDPQANNEGLHLRRPGLLSSIPNLTPMIDQSMQPEPSAYPSNISIPRAPPENVRSLIQRPETMIGSQRVASLIFNTLKSYPQMMLRHNSLPPFINAQFMSSDTEDNDMESLFNCVSLVHMISSGVRGSRKLFWKNVRLECERFSAEHTKFNKWELLAAMQSLAVYLLLRLDEGETAFNNLDFLLLRSVTMIAIQLNSIAAISPHSDQMSWKDWVFDESIRRLCVVYQVVNMLVYFDPADMCRRGGNLLLAPLPAKRQLWEATDEVEWRLQNEKGSGDQTDYALTTAGDLVKLDDGQWYCNHEELRYQSSDFRSPSRSKTNWGDWSSSMDTFGILIVLTASLTGSNDTGLPYSQGV